MKPGDRLLAILVTAIWGTNFVFIRYGLDEIAPFTLAALRFTLVALPLVFFVPRPAVSWAQLASYGVLIGFGQFGLLFWAMRDDITPGLASLIIQVQVFFTVLLALFFGGESISARQLRALLVAGSGLALIIYYSDGETTRLGVAVVLIAAASWAGGNIIVKRAGEVNVLAFIAWSSLFSIPPLVAMAAVFEGSRDWLAAAAGVSWRGWAVVLWQSIGNTLIGYGLWNLLLSRYPAATVAPWALLVPVFGMAASALMLAEPMPWWKLLAAGLICLGLALNTPLRRGANRSDSPVRSGTD